MRFHLLYETSALCLQLVLGKLNLSVVSWTSTELQNYLNLTNRNLVFKYFIRLRQPKSWSSCIEIENLSATFLHENGSIYPVNFSAAVRTSDNCRVCVGDYFLYTSYIFFTFSSSIHLMRTSFNSKFILFRYNKL